MKKYIKYIKKSNKYLIIFEKQIKILLKRELYNNVS